MDDGHGVGDGVLVVGGVPSFYHPDALRVLADDGRAPTMRHRVIVLLGFLVQRKLGVVDLDGVKADIGYAALATEDRAYLPHATKLVLRRIVLLRVFVIPIIFVPLAF